jgi:hypothetical protein
MQSIFSIRIQSIDNELLLDTEDSARNIYMYVQKQSFKTALRKEQGLELEIHVYFY